MSAKPLWACAACRGADAGGLFGADGAGGVDVVDDEIGAEVVGVGFVAVGVGFVAVGVGFVAVGVGFVAVGASGNC
jgi:hypothetical protein